MYCKVPPLMLSYSWKYSLRSELFTTEYPIKVWPLKVATESFCGQISHSRRRKTLLTDKTLRYTFRNLLTSVTLTKENEIRCSKHLFSRLHKRHCYLDKAVSQNKRDSVYDAMMMNVYRVCSMSHLNIIQELNFACMGIYNLIRLLCF